MRNLNSIIALAACTLSCATASAAADFKADGIAYNILADRDNCVEVATDYSLYMKEAITVPEKVTYDGKEYTVVGLGTSAFANTYGKLKSLTLPSTVTYFGDKSLKSVRFTEFTIPENVDSIGVDVFSGCSSLTAFHVADGNKYFAAQDGVLFNKDMTKLYNYPVASEATSYTIPASVVETASRAFDSSKNLTEVVLSDAMQTIGASTFTSCTALESIDFGQAVVTSIGESAFYGCKMLRELDLRRHPITAIGKSMFYNCTALEKLYIPSTVTEFGDYSFNGLKALQELHMQAEKPAQFTSIGRKFSDFMNNELTVLYVPTGCKAAYEADETYAGAFKDIVEESVETGIGSAQTASAGARIALSAGRISFGGDAADIRVFGMDGNEVLRHTGKASSVSVAGLAAGVYVAKAVVDGKTVSAKICINK